MIDTESECCAVKSKHVNMSYYHCDMTVMAVFALCYLGGRSLVRNRSVRNKILQERPTQMLSDIPAQGPSLDQYSGLSNW